MFGPGPEFAVRAQQNMCWIPIIVATGFREMQTEALHGGADDFVVKSFSPTELLARVNALLRVRHLENDIDSGPAHIGNLRRNLAAKR